MWTRRPSKPIIYAIYILWTNCLRGEVHHTILDIGLHGGLDAVHCVCANSSFLVHLHESVTVHLAIQNSSLTLSTNMVFSSILSLTQQQNTSVRHTHKKCLLSTSFASRSNMLYVTGASFVVIWPVSFTVVHGMFHCLSTFSFLH